MPSPHALKRPIQPNQRKLLVLAAVVLVAHLWVLGGVPGSVGFLSDSPPESEQTALSASFFTRTIPPPATRAPEALAPPASPPAPPAPVRATAPAAAPPTMAAAPAPPNPHTPEPAPTADATELPVAVNMPTPAASKPPESVASSPSPLAPSTAAAAAAEVQHAKKVSYAAPVLLLYDGVGEEKGYIKYSASGELAWQPEAVQYKARLELSTFGFRVRTWTSKGELTDGGLQPTRFGDKPRGAEQATHFQRDKGIISFSANNPDVPLQAGAQDKLSAILQLSALLAGDPAHFPAGAAIHFQAADAHRAEVWTFKVGANETLDLPGGTQSTIKLTKEPTVEFDQRIEVWLAPAQQYLPVRIRITEASGAFADLLWRKSQKPE